MEPDTSSVDVAIRSLRERGYTSWEAPEVGDDILNLERKGFPFWTGQGLDFCKDRVLYEARIRPILESMFNSRCILAHWVRYSAKPGRIICFRGGGPKVRQPRFMVHLLPKDSLVAYYSGSHLVELPVRKTDYLFYEILLPDLDRAGFTGEDCESKGGKIVIIDARLSMEIKQGFAIAFVFATEDVRPKWPPMMLPNRPELQHKVWNEMDSPTIGVNFAFAEPATDTGLGKS